MTSQQPDTISSPIFHMPIEKEKRLQIGENSKEVLSVDTSLSDTILDQLVVSDTLTSIDKGTRYVFRTQY